MSADERWPLPLPVSSPYSAARIAQRIARSWQRDEMMHTEASFEIAALLSPRAEECEKCLIRSDYARGEVPECGITPPPISATHPYAYYSVGNPYPVYIPRIKFNFDGTIEPLQPRLVYAYEPIRFIGGNPIVDGLIKKSRTKNGLFMIDAASRVGAMFRLCPDGSPVHEQVEIYELPVVAQKVVNAWYAPTEWDMGEYAGHAISDSPTPPYWYGGGVIGYSFAADVPVSTPLRLSLYHSLFPSAQPYGGDDFPQELYPSGAVIEGGLGFRIPEGIPGIPVPKTGGVARVRALGLDYYGVIINGNWHVQVKFNGAVELGLRKWAGVGQDTTYTLSLYGTTDGIEYFEALRTDSQSLSVGPVTFNVQKDTYYTLVIEPEIEFDHRIEYTLKSVTVP